MAATNPTPTDAFATMLTGWEQHRDPPTNEAMSALDQLLRRYPRPISEREFHVLLGLAAAQLLAPDDLERFLASFADDACVAVTYEPISIATLSNAVYKTLRLSDSRERLALLTTLAACNQAARPDAAVAEVAASAPYPSGDEPLLAPRINAPALARLAHAVVIVEERYPTLVTAEAIAATKAEVVAAVRGEAPASELARNVERVTARLAYTAAPHETHRVQVASTSSTEAAGR